MTNDKNMEDMLTAARLAGFKLHNIITWNKHTKIQNRWYMKQTEWIIYFYKGRAQMINYPNTSNMIHKPLNGFKKIDHPSQKDPSLMEIFIKNSSKPGDLVLDPFAGVASTGVAAARLRRRFKGIEINSNYAKIAKHNLEIAYGIKPEINPGGFVQDKLFEEESNE